MFGGECYWCHWGWPKAIADIYARAEADIEDCFPQASEENDWHDWRGEPLSGEQALEFGPAHVVWNDENFDDSCVHSCLRGCDDAMYSDWYPPAMEIVRRSLRELLAVPATMRESPSGYDGQHPELCPPPAEWECQK